ncbi:hypothetical protein L1049_016641 [Liquidambar formosana]|uniref:Uncharacterized protein n=1 Tax=Liquidambar formosana TaxID=63359 RepID=A0AAP0S068_LIQFO
MGTEILRPQDILIERLRVTPAVFPRRKYVYGNPKPNRKPALRATDKQDRNRRFTGQAEPSISKRSSSDDLKSTRSNNIVMGQVTILRRGESLDSKIKSEVLQKDGDDLMVLGTQRLGPDPEMVPKQIRVKDLKTFLSPVAARPDVLYAGSAFSLSPSPSSLPLPSFSKKKQPIVVDDSATRDLRRLLRLD